MKELPILFSGPMVRAILAGRKTQTRRVVSQKHLPFLKDLLGGWMDGEWNQRPMPYGKPGDRLWVRETWREFEYPSGGKSVSFRADVTYEPIKSIWKPSIFMPRWASRITLEIVAVRVERLQDISAKDALAEGIVEWKHPSGEPPNYYGLTLADVWETSPTAAFKRLWDSINAERGYGWDSDPWVWVIQFQKVKG